MNPLAGVVAAVAAIALAAVALGLLALFQTRVPAGGAGDLLEAARAQFQAEISVLRSALEACSTQIRELQEQRAANLPGVAPKAALNLGKRSQAIRMHRRGDPPELIAAALEIPRQEVDLLLKVHRIVIGSLGS
jgi:hypothetical protein